MAIVHLAFNDVTKQVIIQETGDEVGGVVTVGLAYDLESVEQIRVHAYRADLVTGLYNFSFPDPDEKLPCKEELCASHAG